MRKSYLCTPLFAALFLLFFAVSVSANEEPFNINSVLEPGDRIVYQATEITERDALNSRLAKNIQEDSTAKKSLQTKFEITDIHGHKKILSNQPPYETKSVPIRLYTINTKAEEMIIDIATTTQKLATIENANGEQSDIYVATSAVASEPSSTYGYSEKWFGQNSVILYNKLYYVRDPGGMYLSIQFLGRRSNYYASNGYTLYNRSLWFAAGGYSWGLGAGWWSEIPYQVHPEDWTDAYGNTAFTNYGATQLMYLAGAHARSTTQCEANRYGNYAGKMSVTTVYLNGGTYTE